jgi:hypothetical protein
MISDIAGAGVEAVKGITDREALQTWRDTTNRPDELDPDSDITDLVPALSRVLGWLSDAKTIERLGLRTAVLLSVVRPDLLPETSLAELSGTTRQNVSKLVVAFRATFGLRESTNQVAKRRIE